MIATRPIPPVNRLFAACILTVGTVIVAGALSSSNLLRRVDLLLFDLLLPLQDNTLSEDIAVVAIDEHSIAELGRWPWDRSLHAQLVQRLHEFGARVVGLDILFPEVQTSNPDGDAQLAASLGKLPSVLAIAPAELAAGTGIAELLPIPDLAAAASALGHVDLEIDADGLCRSTFLRAGLGEPRWHSLPLAMLNTQTPYEMSSLVGIPVTNASGWVRSEERLIPYTSTNRQPPLIPFADVLSGSVQPDSLRDKYILVGTTATGLSDMVATPGARTEGLMPGVLVNAQILNGLINGTLIAPLSRASNLLVGMSLSGVLAATIFFVPGRLTLPWAIAAVAVALMASTVLLLQSRVWFAPAASSTSLLVLGVAWGIWQQQRSQSNMRHLMGEMHRLTNHHHATGLPTSQMMEQRLNEIGQSDGEVAALAVIHINWPGSASVVLDRPISNELLRGIRNRLLSFASKDQFVAHLNGDDFALLSQGFASQKEAEVAVVGCLDQLQRPLTVDGESLLLVPQIGVSYWPDDTENPGELLSNAYAAMFTSRIDDTAPINRYSATVRHQIRERSRLEQALVNALDKEEFELFFQPQVSASDGRIRGVEALLRWNNPELGWVSPGSFIPVAEYVGLIQPIGAWVIGAAFRQLKIWRAAGHESLRLAINISPRQFLGSRLEQDVERAIADTEIDPRGVELEITESTLMRDKENAIRVMNALRKEGLALAIDDFGTGYSSLGSLRDFPLDRLKIDISFVRDIGKRQEAEKLAITIIAIARQLDLQVVAEGVETQEQADFLREHACDELQGFLFSRPLPADQFTELLEKSSLGLKWY